MNTQAFPPFDPATPDPQLRDRCRGNLARVRDAVAEACRQASRAAETVRIVGVTKYVPPAWAAMLLENGCADLGESRPQNLWERATAFSAAGTPWSAARWHLIGRLQRTKVRRTLPLVSLIHSLDSRRLLDEIAAESLAQQRRVEALVEVNLDGDPGRSGIAPEEVGSLLDAAAGRPVEIRGLMGMASAPTPGGPTGDDGTARRQFALLRALRDRHAADHPGLVELSMGMSGDFVDAILEGATIVRIGSTLWEGMDDSKGEAG
jgi:pyridoxal phosphate enzyme (YggS family)